MLAAKVNGLIFQASKYHQDTIIEVEHFLLKILTLEAEEALLISALHPARFLVYLLQELAVVEEYSCIQDSAITQAVMVVDY